MNVRGLIALTQERDDLLKRLDTLLSHDKVIKNFDLNTLNRVLKKAKNGGYVNELISRLLGNDKFKSSVKPIDQLYFVEYCDDFRTAFKYFGEELIQTIKEVEPHNMNSVLRRRKGDIFEFIQYLNEVAPSVIGKIVKLYQLMNVDELDGKESDLCKLLLSNKYFTHNMKSEQLTTIIEEIGDPFISERYLSEKKIKQLFSEFLSDDDDRNWMEKNIEEGNIPKKALKFIMKYK